MTLLILQTYCFRKIRLVFTLFYLLLFSFSGVLGQELPATEFSESNDADQKIIVGQIRFEKNKTTRSGIIYRELLFNPGDTLNADVWERLLEQSRLNLLNTSLFNFVDIETSRTEGELPVVDVVFSFVERWYLWPVPVVELADRNFNEWWRTRDFSRINYGLVLNHKNFRGRKELLQAVMIGGYNQSLGIAYSKPNINRAQTIGLGFGATYSRRHEVAYATKNDELAYYDDPGRFSFKGFDINTSLLYRPLIHHRHILTLQYSQYIFSDTINKLNPHYFISSNSKPNFLSLIYEFRSDYRNLKYYPTAGHYFDLKISKQGFGFFQNSKLNVFDIASAFKKYFTFSDRWYLLTGVSVKLSLADRQPYFMSSSLGYKYDFIRGYEYYVVDGRHTALTKLNLKYCILEPTIIHLPFIPTEKFSKLHLSLYLGMHSDMGYVYEPNNNNGFNNKLPNSFLWGNGFGLDVVTYYDQVMRIEYSINRKGEHGVFLHFLAPI